MANSDAYNTGASNIQNATNSGNSALSSFDPTSWATQTQNGLNGITASQAAGNQDLVNAFKSQISNQPSATDYYNQGMSAFNVPGLQQTSNNLNSAILNTPNSNLDAARGYNYDSNQISQKNSQDLQRLAPAAAAAQNNASTAQQNAIAYQNAGLQQNQTNLVPLQQQATAQADLFARQQSGFLATSQSQLQALQDKLNQGIALSTAEMSAYQSLSSQEMQYQASLASNQAAIKQAQIGASNVSIPQGGTYFNPATNAYYQPNVGSGVVGK